MLKFISKCRLNKQINIRMLKHLFMPLLLINDPVAIMQNEFANKNVPSLPLQILAL